MEIEKVVTYRVQDQAFDNEIDAITFFTIYKINELLSEFIVKDKMDKLWHKLKDLSYFRNDFHTLLEDLARLRTLERELEIEEEIGG